MLILLCLEIASDKRHSEYNVNGFNKGGCTQNVLVYNFHFNALSKYINIFSDFASDAK